MALFSFRGVQFGQVFVDADQLDDAGEYLHGKLQIAVRREGRGDADVAVVGILAIGVGGTGTGEDQAGFLAPGNDLPGAAVQRVKGHKVAALGVGPAADAQTAQLPLQRIVDDLKLGPQNFRVTAHVFHHAVDVPEEPDVPQLVDLVVSNGLNLHLGADVHQIVLGGGKG